jgi:hypothetical protein
MTNLELQKWIFLGRKYFGPRGKNRQCFFGKKRLRLKIVVEGHVNSNIDIIVNPSASNSAEWDMQHLVPFVNGFDVSPLDVHLG